MFSAINAALYVGPRTLYGLAQEGQAPKIFAWTNKNGVPVVSLAVMNLIGFLSLLNLSSGAGVVYTWIISITGLATFITCKLSTLPIQRSSLTLVDHRGSDLSQSHPSEDGPCCTEHQRRCPALSSARLAVLCLPGTCWQCLLHLLPGLDIFRSMGCRGILPVLHRRFAIHHFGCGLEVCKEDEICQPQRD